MFSIRQEGRPFQSGFNFQVGTGKYPYVSAHFVHVNFTNDTVKRWSVRLRFRLWPMLLCHKTEYNFIDERLKEHDAVTVSRVWYEDMVYSLKIKELEDQAKKAKGV